MSTFLHSLWAWAQKFDAPAPLPAAAIAPVAPPMTQDQFEVEPGLRNALEAQAQAEHALNVRLIRSNNAFVTRDYGWGPVLVHYDSTVPDLAAHEMAKLAGNKLNPVKFRRSGRADHDRI